MRIALGISYLGTAYQGWQSQPSGQTVQDRLESALGQFATVPIATLCAGRTDAGVHGLMQVVHFDTDLVREPFSWVRGTNRFLPPDIAVQWAQPVPDAFHARASALARRYTYVLLESPVRPSVDAGRVGWTFRPLDGDALRQGATHLIGEHDFTSFRASACQALSPVKHLTRIDISRRGAYWRFDFEASAFLQHMVRNLVGSLVYVGGMALDAALSTVGIDGATVGECLERIGYAGQEPCGQPQVQSYVELHVEQGPVLEAEGFHIGAVDGVQGISWTEFSVLGVSNHAGTTPMRLRHDAGYVAFAIANYARQIAREMGANQVATVGAVQLSPNLVNVIPYKAVLTVDLRNTDEAALQLAEQRLHRFARDVASAEGVTLSSRQLARFEPVDFDPDSISLVEATAKNLGLRVKRMPSGAGHDAQMLARVCPTAMIFVPSAGGISHNMKEFTSPSDLEAGANVLLHTLLRLAS